MSTSERERFRFSVSGGGPSTSLKLFNASGEICAKGDEFEGISVKLPRGLYTLRAERGGRINDKSIRLDSEMSVSADLPQTYTPATLPGAYTSHEYYTKPAWRISQQHTALPLDWNGPANAGLMLFIRAPDRDLYHKNPEDHIDAAGLSLKALDGSVICAFTPAETEINRDDGFLGFSASISPGMVLLEDAGQRQVPIPLVQGFQTQLYLMHRRRRLFEDLRMFTAHDEDIDSREHRSPYGDHPDFMQSYEYIDAGFGALQNDVGVIGDSMVNAFLRSKFKNPVLGLIGAYLMLLRRHLQPLEAHTDRLPRIVIENLQGLLGETADIHALRYLAAPWLGAPQLKKVQGIPVFRIGASVLIDAAVKRPQIIPRGSWLDRLSDKILDDTPWTTWEPVDLTGSGEAMDLEDDPSWVEFAIADMLDAAKENLDEEDLVRRLGITRGAVRKAVGHLRMRADHAPERFTEVGIDASGLERSLLAHVSTDLLQEAQHQFDPAGVLAWSPAHQITPNPTFQTVYPDVKATILEISDLRAEVRASDEIRKYIDDEEKTKLRKRILEQIAIRFPDLRLSDLSAEFTRTKTVRDIANLLVKKKGL